MRKLLCFATCEMRRQHSVALPDDGAAVLTPHRKPDPMKKQLLVASLLSIVAASTAQAQPCVQTFGTLSAATWGGNGIPNNSAVINNCVDGLTLGLTTHSRGNGNPPVTNNGISTFFASAGPDVSTAPPAQPTYATWNFALYVSAPQVNEYGFRLYFDFDAAPGSAGLGYVQWTGLSYQDSWNNGMPFLSNPGLVAQVPTGTFDRNAGGDYSYRLVAYTNGFQNEVAAVNMNVVTSTVPEPSTYVLMASGLLSLGLAARRRQGRATVA